LSGLLFSGNGGGVKNSDFVNCDMRGAKFVKTKILGCTFPGCVYDDTTVWPQGFVPENHGCTKSPQFTAPLRAALPG
jgi:hypothetical protein